MTKNDKVWIAFGVVSFLAIVSYVAVFFSRYEIKAQNPVHVQVQKAVWIQKRVVAVTNVVNVTEADENVSPLTPDQQFGCNLFGASQCRTFLAIMAAESHGNHNAIDIDSNGTADIGCMQISTIHLAQIDTSNLNLLNCQDNIRAAYAIWSKQGWTPWSSYVSGAYKQYLIQ